MDYAVIVTQKAILKAFDIDADCVCRKALELSMELEEYEGTGSREG